jgi:hypothetical protein
MHGLDSEDLAVFTSGVPVFVWLVSGLGEQLCVYDPPYEHEASNSWAEKERTIERLEAVDSRDQYEHGERDG